MRARRDRSSTRSALALGAVAATALVWSGCEAKKQTEYVAGVSTQVQVPRDLKAIRIDVSVGGVVQFCRGYKAYDGKVHPPAQPRRAPLAGNPRARSDHGHGQRLHRGLLGVHRQQRVRQLHERGGEGRRPEASEHAHPAPQPSAVRGRQRPLLADAAEVLLLRRRRTARTRRRPARGAAASDATTDETKLPKYSDDLDRRHGRHVLQRERLLRGRRAGGRRQRRGLHVRVAELAAQLAPAARGRPAEPVSEERRRRQRRAHLRRRSQPRDPRQGRRRGLHHP